MLKTVTMKPIHLVVLTVVQMVSTEPVGSFFNPPQMPHDVEVLFSSNPIYRAGEVISVEWTTTYSEYTIALWQQDLIQDGAVLGPIVFGTSSPDIWLYRLILGKEGSNLNMRCRGKSAS